MEANAYKYGEIAEFKVNLSKNQPKFNWEWLGDFQVWKRNERNSVMTGQRSIQTNTEGNAGLYL